MKTVNYAKMVGLLQKQGEIRFEKKGSTKGYVGNHANIFVLSRHDFDNVMALTGLEAKTTYTFANNRWEAASYQPTVTLHEVWKENYKTEGLRSRKMTGLFFTKNGLDYLIYKTGSKFVALPKRAMDALNNANLAGIKDNLALFNDGHIVFASDIPAETTACLNG